MSFDELETSFVRPELASLSTLSSINEARSQDVPYIHNLDDNTSQHIVHSSSVQGDPHSYKFGV